MTPAIIALLSLTILVLLCGGLIVRPKIAAKAQNTPWLVAVRPLDFYRQEHGDMAAIVQRGVYAQERVEMVLRWICGGVVGLFAALWAELWPWAYEPAASVELAFAVGMLLLATVLAYPLFRRRFEPIGHAAELAVVDDEAPGDFAKAYRVREIAQMTRTGSVYGRMFVDRDVAGSLRRAEPSARAMLALIRPALRRFEALP